MNHTPLSWEVQDRRKSGISSFIEDGISKEDYPFSIMVPAPPFAFGATGMLVARNDTPEEAEANARLIVEAVNTRPALLAQVAKLRELLDNIISSRAYTDEWHSDLADAQRYLEETK